MFHEFWSGWPPGPLTTGSGAATRFTLWIIHCSITLHIDCGIYFQSLDIWCEPGGYEVLGVRRFVCVICYCWKTVTRLQCACHVCSNKCQASSDRPRACVADVCIAVARNLPRIVDWWCPFPLWRLSRPRLECKFPVQLPDMVVGWVQPWVGLRWGRNS